MAPLALSVINDRLGIASVEWSIKRNDEFSGLGSGDIWQAELADPLWTADVTLGRGMNEELKRIAALIRRLDGARQAFLLVDPLSPYPQTDPDGSILGDAEITIRSVDTDRFTARLGGFPLGYGLSLGDKLQITQGDMIRFHEVSRSEQANGAGNMDVLVFPRLPLSLAAGAIVTLKRPACPVVIEPNSHKPGVARRMITEGAGFRVLQKKRS